MTTLDHTWKDELRDALLGEAGRYAQAQAELLAAQAREIGFAAEAVAGTGTVIVDQRAVDAEYGTESLPASPWVIDALGRLDGGN